MYVERYTLSPIELCTIIARWENRPYPTGQTSSGQTSPGQTSSGQTSAGKTSAGKTSEEELPVERAAYEVAYQLTNLRSLVADTTKVDKMLKILFSLDL